MFQSLMGPALTELLARYETLALRYVAGRVKDEEAARDLCQDVVRAILESRKEFASADHLRNYFFAALRNAAVDFLKGRGRSREVPLPDDACALPGGAAAAGDPAGRLIAEEEAARHEERARVLEEALARLPEEERAFLRQRFWERKTFREIGEATGRPISTLKSREDAILRRLKKSIGKGGSEEY